MRLPELSPLGLVLVSLAGIAVVTLVQRLQAAGPRRRRRAAAASGTARRAARGIVALVAVGAVAFGAALAVAPAPETAACSASSPPRRCPPSAEGGLRRRRRRLLRRLRDRQLVGLLRADRAGRNALPGPILVKVAAAIGFVVGRSRGRRSPGSSPRRHPADHRGRRRRAALGVLAAYDRASHSRFIRNVGAYILRHLRPAGSTSSLAPARLCRDRRARGRRDACRGDDARARGGGAARPPRRAVPDLAFIIGYGALTLGVMALLAR